MKRRATIALFGILTLVGCQNMGLDDPGTGEEGRNRAPSDLVSAVHRSAPAATQAVIVDGRRWMPAGTPIALDASELRSVGSSAGQTLYARQWDTAPFDVLYVRSQPTGSPARQPTPDTAGDPTAAAAGETDSATSPAAAGARGTTGTSGQSGPVEWQPLMPVVGEDGGAPAPQDRAGSDAQDAPVEEASPQDPASMEEDAVPEDPIDR